MPLLPVFLLKPLYQLGSRVFAYGNELMYSGRTGGQLRYNIFIGPNYYQRLKLMVSDKINYRSVMSQNVLIDNLQRSCKRWWFKNREMERDALLSHGGFKRKYDGTFRWSLH